MKNLLAIKQILGALLLLGIGAASPFAAKKLTRQDTASKEFLLFDCNISDRAGLQFRRLSGRICNLLDDGGALVSNFQYVRRVDATGATLWKKKTATHHQTVFDEARNRFLLLTYHFYQKGSTRYKFDNIMIIDPDGKELANYDFYYHRDEIIPFDHVGTEGIPFDQLEPAPDPFPNEEVSDDWAVIKDHREYTHANSIFILPENPLAAKDPAFSPGNILVNITERMLLIFDPDLKKILWRFPYRNRIAGDLHDVQLSKAGKLFYFKNLYEEDASSIEELDPLTGERNVIKAFNGPDERFFSKTQGGVQLLANGNYLVSGNDNKRGTKFFEVTPQGKVVWSQNVAPRGKGTVFTIQQARIVDLEKFFKKNTSL